MEQKLEEASMQYANNNVHKKSEYYLSNHSLAKEAFEAGAEWVLNQVHCIPVSERLPNKSISCLVYIGSKHDNEIRIRTYLLGTGFISHAAVKTWCPIPDTLLNLHP